MYSEKRDGGARGEQTISSLSPPPPPPHPATNSQVNHSYVADDHHGASGKHVTITLYRTVRGKSSYDEDRKVGANTRQIQAKKENVNVYKIPVKQRRTQDKGELRKTDVSI